MRKLIVFILLLYPVYSNAYLFIFDKVDSANPVDYLIDTSGEWALGMLVLTLALTPLRKLFKDPEFSKYKRMIGLYAFFYATIHLLTYVGLDHNFNWSEIFKQITNVKYIIVGFIAWFLMVPLALTSNLFSQRLLKKKWKLLHTTTYGVAIFAITHYLWLVKTIYWEPFIYAAITFLLLLTRSKISFKDFWFQYGGLVKMFLVMSPIIAMVILGFVNRVPPQTVAYEAIQSALPKDQQAPHIYNAEYFICYENSINAGQSFETRVELCSELWKEPNGKVANIEPKEKELSIAEQKRLNIIKQINGDY